MTYYNTNKEKGAVLRQSDRKAETQEIKIAQFFVRYPKSHFSPEDVWRLVFKGEIPLTSVRRAMTNVCNEGWIVKTDTMKDGMYGKKVHTWKLTPISPDVPQNQLKLDL